MRSKLQWRPSPAFALAFIALCVALGGTATALEGTNGVSKDDIRRGAVGKSEVRTDAIGKSELIEEVITGGQVSESTLQGVATASGLTHFAVVDDNGVINRGRGVTGTARTSEGTYNVVFNRDITRCAHLASIGRISTGGSQSGEISTRLLPGGVNNLVRVRTRDSGGGLSDREFHLAIVC